MRAEDNNKWQQIKKNQMLSTRQHVCQVAVSIYPYHTCSLDQAWFAYTVYIYPLDIVIILIWVQFPVFSLLDNDFLMSQSVLKTKYDTLVVTTISYCLVIMHVLHVTVWSVGEQYLALYCNVKYVLLAWNYVLKCKFVSVLTRVRFCCMWYSAVCLI